MSRTHLRYGPVNHSSFVGKLCVQVVDEPDISVQICRCIALQIHLEGPKFLLHIHSNGI